MLCIGYDLIRDSRTLTQPRISIADAKNGGLKAAYGSIRTTERRALQQQRNCTLMHAQMRALNAVRSE
jgi:hypothetical protein